MRANSIQKVSVKTGLPEGDVLAVLLAIRQPTPAMLKAACGAMSPSNRPTQRRIGNKAKHGVRYRAMIDALIGEQN